MKKLISIFAIFTVCICFGMSAYAEEMLSHRYGKDGRWVYSGGVNTFAGTTYQKTKEDCQKLEEKLRAYGYICVYGQGKDISNEEYNKYLYKNPYGIGFEDYAQANTNDKYEVYYQRFFKVYLSKLSYEDYKKSIDSEGYPLSRTLDELRDSYVVVDYAMDYSMSKQGKIIDEINDRIPVWWNAGYLLVKSPKDVKMTIYHVMEGCYNELYIKKNEPYLVRLKLGNYIVTQLNGKSIDQNEEFLPFNNNINIGDFDNDKEHPYELKLEEVIKNRDIPTIDLDEIIEKDNVEKEKAYENLYEEVSKETTIIDSDYTENQKKKWSYIITGIMVLICLICVVIYKVAKRKNKGK